MGNCKVHYPDRQNDHEKRRRTPPRRASNKQDFFVLSDPEYFENYSKYVKLFDEIFREGAKPIHRHIAVREGVVLW